MITLKKINAMRKNRIVEKTYFKDTRDNEYLLTNLNGIILSKKKSFYDYETISNNARDIRDFIIKNELRECE